MARRRGWRFSAEVFVFSSVLDLQVPHDVREARRDELVSLQQDVGQDFAESLVGCQVLEWTVCALLLPRITRA